jgi:TetR/AcrR family transcriptional regulator, transcriptional repressor for nem operon
VGSQENETESTDRGRDSAERLLDAADTLMYDRGYHDVGVAELCREAGVRPGSFYYYFPSKEALAAAMLERSWIRTEQRIFSPAFDDHDLDVLEAIERYAELLEGNLRTLKNQSGVTVGCRFGNFATETAQHLPLVRDVTRTVFENMTTWFERLVARGQHHGRIEPDIDPKSAAMSLLALMEGFRVIAKATDDPATIRRLAEEARRVLALPYTGRTTPSASGPLG